MSGGALELSHMEWQFEETINQIKNYIDEREEKGYPLKQETKDKLHEGINIIKKAKVYINKIDYLIADDDGEQEFHDRLLEDLSNEYFYE